MSGYPQHNFPLFNRVARLLREQSYGVFNPAENKDGGTLRSRAYYMRLDIPALLASEAVVALPGWQNSRGASLEVWIAIDLGMSIYHCRLTNNSIVLEPVERLNLACLPFFCAPRRFENGKASHEHSLLQEISEAKSINDKNLLPG